MLVNSIVQHRAKHIDLLLAQKLSSIEREHSKKLMTYQKLENVIRRANYQLSNNNRTKICIPFDHIYNEQTESIDYHSIRNNINNINSNQKHRVSFGAMINNSSNDTSRNQINMDQNDEFINNTSSSTSLRSRRYSTKTYHLPPILKANLSYQQKRKNKNNYWMNNFQQTNTIKDDLIEPFTIIHDDISKPILPEITPIQRQVRSFLETLPTYKGVQHGFDSFASTSLYSNRAPVSMR